MHHHAPAPGTVPERVLLAWHPLAFEKAVSYTRATDAGVRVGSAVLHRGEWAGDPVGVLAPGPGPAAAALAAGALAAAGTKVMVGVGGAFALGALEAAERILLPHGAHALDAVTPRFLTEGAPRRVDAFPNVAAALAVAVHDEQTVFREGDVATVDAPWFATREDARRAANAGGLVMDAHTAPLLAAARAGGARAGALLVVEGALARFAGEEWDMDAGGSALAYGWFPADREDVDRAVRAATRAAFATLLGDLAATPEA